MAISTTEVEDYILQIKQGKIPLFEIIKGDERYRIYYSGRVEGFQESVGIINQIPILYRFVYLLAQEKIRHHQKIQSETDQAQGTALHCISGVVANKA